MSKTPVSRSNLLAAVEAYAEAHAAFAHEQEYGSSTDERRAKVHLSIAKEEVVRLIDSLNLPLTFAELAEKEKDLVDLYRAAKRMCHPQDTRTRVGVVDALDGAKRALKWAAGAVDLDGDAFIQFLNEQEG